MTSAIGRARVAFHSRLAASILTLNARGVASNADTSSKPSRDIAADILDLLGGAQVAEKTAGQTAGATFEEITGAYLAETLAALAHLRPGEIHVQKGGQIADFQQYAHLDDLDRITRANRDIATALGTDYLIKPDVIVALRPWSELEINGGADLVRADEAQLTGARAFNDARPLLLASVSCKWTLRSDRAQNARSEGLNLVRNRKGGLARIAVVTAEPLPSRIASLALGTGDIDCVYHFALKELRAALEAPGRETYLDTLEMMIEGQRLRDIADLPFDLLL
ncbi:MAG: NgoMIV family type II restriction endonuclease [Silicimonas sp.]|nr:NgoMIV family type II restriction endonuclease [Silicimonas sp.]